MIEDIVTLNPIQRIIDDALALLDPFTTKDGKKLRIELRDLQTNKKTPLKLIHYNHTRWLSRFAALQRIVKLKTEIKQVAVGGGLDPRSKLSAARDEQFWIKLEKIVLPI